MDGGQSGQWVHVDDVETGDFFFSCETLIGIVGMIYGVDVFCFGVCEVMWGDVLIVQLV